MSNQVEFTEQIQNYIITQAMHPHPILTELVNSTRQLSCGRMSTHLDQISFITFLLKLINARRVIEVGVFTGCATLGMALALPDDGEVIACDIDEHWTFMGRDHWQRADVADKISLHIAPAQDTLAKLLENGQQGSFDAIFIDADKRGYPDYYEQGLQLIRHGGLIIVDNMLWGGKVVDQTIQDKNTMAIRETLNIMQTDERIELSLVPVGDGMALARKR